MGAVSFLLLPALLLLLVVDGHALVENESCKQGTIFRRDCNLCLCGASGSRQLSTCTTWSCNKPGAMINRIKRAAGHSERCFPGDRYKKDCNDCICSQDGIKDHASCTFALCPNKPR